MNGGLWDLVDGGIDAVGAEKGLANRQRGGVVGLIAVRTTRALDLLGESGSYHARHHCAIVVVVQAQRPALRVHAGCLPSPVLRSTFT